VRAIDFPYGAADDESALVDQDHKTTVAPNREKDTAALRYKRYKAVVDRLVERTDFELSHLHEACNDERPGFVTRLVNELVETGWLLREDNSSSQNYRWNKGQTPLPAQPGPEDPEPTRF
jgi:hypothetical protein